MGIEIKGPVTDAQKKQVLTPEALSFLVELHKRFNATRLELLEARKKRAAEIRGGKMPAFLDETKSVREGSWTVGATPADLQDRRVEITGPVEAKMIIKALAGNSY